MPAMFDLGQVVATPGALQALQSNGILPTDLLERHVQGDWGDLTPSDKRLNDLSVNDGTRILSAYNLRHGAKVWVITEAKGDDGRRAATTILLPSEY